jgi:hypothetical protein
MRARLILLLLVVLAVAGFAALNWGEVMRPSSLNFGLFRMDAPLGAILLTLLAVGVLAYMIGSAALRSRMMITENRYTRDLQVQRDLADKAEASRFTELRQYLDSHFRDHRQREAMVSTEFEKSMMQSQRDLRSQMEQLHHTLATRLGELETRMNARLERFGPADDVRHRPIEVPPRESVKL